MIVSTPQDTPQDHELVAWLGPAIDDLSEQQYATFARLVRATLDPRPEWTATPEARADHADDIEKAHRLALRIVEPLAHRVHPGAGQRPPEPGERCSCGRPAVVVFRTANFGDVASCRR